MDGKRREVPSSCDNKIRCLHHLLSLTMALSVAETTDIKETKRKSIFDRFFSRDPKRARTSMADTVAQSKNMTTNSANVKVGGANEKPSLKKSRKNEVKQRLNAEASNEIRPLAVGTLAMMVSALSNQGRWSVDKNLGCSSSRF